MVPAGRTESVASRMAKGAYGLNLGDLLEEAANRGPESPFLLTGEEVVTYAEALRRTNGLAWLLSDLGVRHGSRVAVVLPNVAETVYTWFALARLGAVMVPINPALVPPEVEPLLRNLDVAGIVGDAKAVAAYGERLHLPVRIVVGEAQVEGATPFAASPQPAPPIPSKRVSPQDLLTILQSSGTTGQPKSAALTHASYVLPAREFVRWMEAVPSDRFLGCLPLFHMAGEAFAASAVAAGASLALVSHFSAHHFWEQVRTHNITLVRHLGEMLTLLCRLPEHPDDLRHTLRACYGGGARADVAQAFERRFGVPVVEGYGLTETNTVLRNELRQRRHGSIGRPLPYCEVRIAGPEGGTLGPAEVGEIQVRRNGVMMSGYVGPAELTAASFVGDWFRTGDLGYRDENDYFHFVGRQKDLIRRRGENIYPGAIEKVLDSHPAVAASAVVGVPDEVGGEEVKAYLVCRPGARLLAQELVAYCRSWLADFETPRYFEICAELPRTATNKINKSELRLVGTTGGLCYDRKSGEQFLVAQGGPPCLHQLFETQAARTPEATALVDGAERSTYAELNRRANQLARHLQLLGVGPEVRVGVLLEPSTELVASLLGILKAGGACVPLDPVYPAQRIAVLAEDAGISLLLTHSRLRGRVTLPGTRMLLLDDAQEAIAAGDWAGPVPLADAVALASTASDLADGLAAKSNGFGRSVFEQFAPLAWGGTVVLAQDALALPDTV